MYGRYHVTAVNVFNQINHIQKSKHEMCHGILASHAAYALITFDIVHMQYAFNRDYERSLGFLGYAEMTEFGQFEINQTKAFSVCDDYCSVTMNDVMPMIIMRFE